MPSKKLLVAEREVKTAQSGNFRLKYYLLSRKSSNDFSNEAVSGQVFGIMIEKETIVRGYIAQYDFESVRGLSYNRGEALKLIEILANMLVTPMSLLDIVDDYIGAQTDGGLCEKIAN